MRASWQQGSDNAEGRLKNRQRSDGRALCSIQKSVYPPPFLPAPGPRSGFADLMTVFRPSEGIKVFCRGFGLILSGVQTAESRNQAIWVWCSLPLRLRISPKR